MAKTRINPRISRAERVVKKIANRITGIYSDINCVEVRAVKDGKTNIYRVYDNGTVTINEKEESV